ncbi:hypothetical protein ANO14919_039900 [Xylariales sp. No.14919]|nr:hypothetical protein ANO14919_039900 [Xylariales sp. No.14919]
MDHFILPNNPIHQQIDVRLRDAQPYDGLTFVDYPDRQGWNTRSAERWLQEFRTPSVDFVAMFERWLLFGPICTFYGSLVTPSDFIRIRNHVPYPFFDIQQFPEIYSNKGTRINTIVEDPIKSIMALTLGTRVNSALTVSRGQDRFPTYRLRTECSLYNFICSYAGSFHDPRNPAVALTTSAILEALSSIMMRCRRALPELQLQPTILTSLGTWHSLIWAKMRYDGWCPSELVRLFGDFNTACLYFLYNLRRPGPHETHQMIRIHKSSVLRQAPPETAPEKLCTAFECIHRKLQEDKYKTRHADGCDGCEEVVGCLDTLQDIIRRGKVPLILSIDENHDEPEIIFVESEPRQPDHSYVSISHVWSDGLGNLERNGLPLCQLRRISRLIRSLPGEQAEIVLFWCDTLCIPPDAAGIPDVQNLAIGQMRNIYADATAVLVLDSWLFTSEMSTASPEEILLKIFCCTWNTRLWTYQEGALAKSLYFQFKDGPYNLDAGFQEACRSATFTSDITIIPALETRYFALREFQAHTAIETKLGAVASALGHRVTSVATDEPLCLAVLLDLDILKIAETKPTARMEAFWKMLPIAVGSAIFNNDTAKLAIDGLRWAPATFLRSPRNVDDDGTPATVDYSDGTPLDRNDKGVMVKCRGIRFLTQRCPFPDKISVMDEDGQWAHWQFSSRNAQGSLSVPEQPDGQPTRRFDPFDTFGCNEVAILVKEAENQTVGSTLNSMPIGTGILVGIDKEEWGVIYCRWITSCHRNSWDVSSQDLVNHFLRFAPKNWAYGDAPACDKSSGCILVAAGKSVASQFCIG